LFENYTKNNDYLLLKNSVNDYLDKYLSSGNPAPTGGALKSIK